jgi:hypothetical protein
MGELDEDTVTASDDSNETLSQGNIWSKPQHAWRSPSLHFCSQWIEATRGTPRQQGIFTSLPFLLHGHDPSVGGRDKYYNRYQDMLDSDGIMLMTF